MAVSNSSKSLRGQLISRLREAFQIEIPLLDLFEAPTISGLARRIEKAMGSKSGLEAPPIKRAARNQPLPLSYAQQRLWFLDQLEPGSPTYNVPTAVRLNGRLSISALAPRSVPTATPTLAVTRIS